MASIVSLVCCFVLRDVPPAGPGRVLTMRRNFLLGIIVCLIPTAIATLYTGLAFNKEFKGDTGFRRGIDLAGGTILVYEVNTERNLARQKQSGADVSNSDGSLSSEDIRKLAENLKRRIDPNDLKNVVVRPVGTNRVEIILPFAGSTGGGKEAANEDFVREVRALVSQVGVLEFRFLANTQDDAEGINEAKRLVNTEDAKAKAELERRAKAGLPPPAPTNTYVVSINGITQDGVSYEWTELGKEERDSLNLSNAFGTDNPPKERNGNERSTASWKMASQSRDKADAVPGIPGLLYSRKFVKQVPAKGEETKQVEYFILTRVSPLDSMKVDREAGLQARPTNNLKPAVSFSFNAQGANRFGKITERNRPTGDFRRYLAIILDDKVVSAPTLNGVLREGGEISGGSIDMPAVNKLVYILKSGALNAELKPDPVSENSVGPTLGQDTINRGLIAVGLSFLAVLIFMVYYYKFAGVVACVALFVNLLLTIGFMVIVSAAFTLPGLAGIVLMLGMAVDANVLIYERIREERDKGANLVTSIRLGYDRAFATIIDTHLTSIFTCLVLYTFGNDNLKGFAVSLTVGLVISLFTSLYMTRLMFDYWTHKRWMTSFTPRMLMTRHNWDFMAIRNQMFALTGFLTVAGLALFLVRGEAGLNVDFTKGTLYSGSLKEGQERALSDVGGLSGFQTLLSEENQKARLKVKDVVWRTPPSTEDTGNKSTSENIYDIIYDDNGKESRVTVTLANLPDGATPEAQQEDLKVRAGELPGASVEQVFRAGESYGSYKSRSFTIRTTEKEPELVQTMLDRLLRDNDGASLLAVTEVTELKIEGTTATLTLSKPASPGYFKAFMTRELKLVDRYPTLGSGSPVDVIGVASEGDAGIEESRSGRYKILKVDVRNNPFFKTVKDAFDAKKALPPEDKEVIAFKTILENAKTAFQARPLPDRLETFDPALAADTRNKAFYAILASWLAILVYLWFRFGSWTFGLAAVICLVHDLAFTLGAIALCHFIHDTTVGHWLLLKDFKIDLAAVAALLTLIGYSVSDTIVVFDRIREVRGKSPALTPQMINDSVNQTLSRTILTALTVFLVSIVLYFLGGEGIHLFSFVMVMGVLVGTYSSIYIASPLLLLFGEGNAEVKEKPLTPVNMPTDEVVA
jgi:SecD/SecF fusion protein